MSEPNLKWRCHFVNEREELLCGSFQMSIPVLGLTLERNSYMITTLIFLRISDFCTSTFYISCSQENRYFPELLDTHFDIVPVRKLY